MRYRKLGKCSDKVSAIGLGGMAMTPIYGPVDPVEANSAVNAALDEGMNFIDTSDAYGGGKNEEFLGDIIKRRREDVFLATKFGNMGGRADGRPEWVK